MPADTTDEIAHARALIQSGRLQQLREIRQLKPCRHRWGVWRQCQHGPSLAPTPGPATGVAALALYDLAATLSEALQELLP